MSKDLFTKVLMPKVGSNHFNLSHDVKTSFNMGYLVPICALEALPGDKFKIGVEAMLRFTPLVAPMMQKVRVTVHYFFCPNRLLWDKWEGFITGDIEKVNPYVEYSNALHGSMADYFGIPTVDGPVAPSIDPYQINAFPLAAYAKIFDEYYRDQNLQTERFTSLIDGDNTGIYGTLLHNEPYKRAWNHDYFTSALPWSQKGDEVEMPLLKSGAVDVTWKGAGQADRQQLKDPVTGNTRNNVSAMGSTAAGNVTGDGNATIVDPNGTLQVLLQGAASSINTLRRAFRLQEWLEKNARGGTRYIENILAHFGVRSSDARLQRPEYIGGSKGYMTISEVLSTSQTVDQSSNDVVIGTMAGHGIGVQGGNSFKYKCEEHGWIMGIMNVQPETAYYNGVHRKWRRSSNLDYYWPSFANIGEQEVLDDEVYMDPVEAQRGGTFGYVPRYSEYKYENNKICGQFKGPLEYWHLARKITTNPVLNESFIECNPDHRVFANTTAEDHKILAHVFNNIRAIRKMPKYGVPTI